MKLSILAVSFYLFALSEASRLRVHGNRGLDSTSGESVSSLSGASGDSDLGSSGSSRRKLSSRYSWGDDSDSSRKSPPVPAPTMRPVTAPVVTLPVTSPPTQRPVASPTVRPTTPPPTPVTIAPIGNRPTPTPPPTKRPTPFPTPGPTRPPTPGPTSPPTPGPTNRPTPRPTPRPTAPQGCAMEFYTLEDVAQHPNANSCWYILYGVVFDFTTYIDRHPGGRGTALAGCGRDSTILYSSNSNHNRNLLATGGFSSRIVGRYGTSRYTGTVPCNEVNLVAVV